MKDLLDQILINNTVEVICHAGDIRVSILGTLSLFGTGGKYVVCSGSSGSASIIFTAENVSKITPSMVPTIYIS